MRSGNLFMSLSDQEKILQEVLEKFRNTKKSRRGGGLIL